MKSKLKKLALASVVVILSLASGVAGANLAQTAEQEKAQSGEASAQPAAVVPQNNEGRYVSVSPCRIADTRSGSNTPLQPNQPRNFAVVSNNLSSQGGSGSGCGIPSQANAIAVNITAVDAAGTGYLRGRDSGICFTIPCGPDPALPNATLLNYTGSFNASNGVNIPICSSFSPGLTFGSCKGGILLGAFTKATDVVVDVVGYYVRPIYANVNGDVDPPVLRSGSGLLAPTNPATGRYEFATPRDLRGCAFSVVAGNSDNADAVSNINASIWDVSSSDFEIRTYDADTGALTNDDFTVSVAC